MVLVSRHSTENRRSNMLIIFTQLFSDLEQKSCNNNGLIQAFFYMQEPIVTILKNHHARKQQRSQ